MSEAMKSDEAMLAEFEHLALAAGAEIMAVFAEGATVDRKADDSPVTEADRRAEAVILAGLRKAYPAIDCVAEEEVSSGRVPPALGHEFFLVDPLDGTKEFIARRPDFTVNIALIRNGEPVIGVVYAPAQGALYLGRPGAATEARVDHGHVAGERKAISVSAPGSPVRVVASRSHRTAETDEFIEKYPGAEIVSVGSSLKFCLLASGQADLYPRFGRTMEWDTAAGDAVLRAAGGSTLRVDGGAFVYGKRNQADDADFANPWFISQAKAS
jgi:3'(2'), 5'-bisphosphate nucleotidase